MAKRTKERRRKSKPHILIMCEGETERNYFQAIKESEAYKRKAYDLALKAKFKVAMPTCPDNLWTPLGSATFENQFRRT